MNTRKWLCSALCLALCALLLAGCTPGDPHFAHELKNVQRPKADLSVSLPAAPEGIPTEGELDGINWFTDGDLLVICSDMGSCVPDFASPEDAPWHPYSENIFALVVEGEVYAIGANAFSGFRNLVEVHLPNTLEYIGPGAFEGCESLEYVGLEVDPNIIHIEDGNDFLLENWTGSGEAYAPDELPDDAEPTTLDTVVAPMAAIGGPAFYEQEAYYCIPMLLIDSEDAAYVNGIFEQLTMRCEEALAKYAEGSQEEELIGVDYGGWVFGNRYLTLIVRYDYFFNDYVEYELYRFDLKDGTLMDNGDVLEVIGISPQEYAMICTDRLYLEWELAMEEFGMTGGEAYGEELLAATVDPANVEQVQLYLEEDGEPMIFFQVYTPAGAGIAYRFAPLLP